MLDSYLFSQLLLLSSGERCRSFCTCVSVVYVCVFSCGVLVFSGTPPGKVCRNLGAEQNLQLGFPLLHSLLLFPLSGIFRHAPPPTWSRFVLVWGSAICMVCDVIMKRSYFCNVKWEVGQSGMHPRNEGCGDFFSIETLLVCQSGVHVRHVLEGASLDVHVF